MKAKEIISIDLEVDVDRTGFPITITEQTFGRIIREGSFDI